MEPSKKKPLNPYIKYTGLAFQMAGPIILGVWGGMTLDEKFESGNLWTIVLSLLGVVTGLYLALKDFIKPQND
ncbi:MAG: AtpZ/AtpI family protein [Flavobacteriales bacterium]